MVEGAWRKANEKANDLVEVASSAADAARDRGAEPDMTLLTYWNNIRQWRIDHPNEEDSSMWRIDNAATRLAADRLHVLGLPIATVYAETEA